MNSSLPTLPKPTGFKRALDALTQQEDINFLLTNRIPRIALTRFIGWFSKIEHPWVAAASIAVWKAFAKLDLSEAKKQRFDSLHDCFTRELKDGARPIDRRPEVLASPCDAIVGECGAVRGTEVFQAKGFPYSIAELFGSEAAAEPWRDGRYVTLRLTSSMYHRFHAPADGQTEHVRYISGDVWNVNPIALKRVERLFCRNERVVLHTRLASGEPMAIVAVAAVLVASVRLHFLNVLLHLRYRGPNEMPVVAPFQKGQELGWFEHGSTLVVFVPAGFELAEGIASGCEIRMGQALLQRRAAAPLGQPG
jgi:phosphatidylserine decarboxylase